MFINMSVPEASCSSPFVGGLSLTDVCSANFGTLFLSTINMLTAYSSVINGVCERITPITKPEAVYDFIVVGGKIKTAGDAGVGRSHRDA